MQHPTSRLAASAVLPDGSFTLAPALGASPAVTSALQPDGSFSLTPALLNTLAGGALRDGAHTLHLVATDKAGKTSSLDLSFVLGAKIAAPSFDLAPASDSGKKGDHATSVILVTQGSTDPNAQLTPLGAEQTASGYEVAGKVTGADQYGVWATDSSGSYTSNIVRTVAGTSSALEMLEPSFHQDLNGDGVIGLAVMSGGIVEVSSAYSGPATFMGSSGILQLDQSASFSGTVAGMTGQDTLDLRDISFATIHSPTYSGTSTGGTLSVSDGTHSAQIALLGNYLASTFVASSDGHGGTNVVDPSIGDEFVGPFPSGINIKTAYGAKADGITDDTAAFQRPLTALGIAGHGNVLWIPAGTYKITSQLTLFGRNGVSIIGEDPATAILKWAGPGVFSTNSTTGSMFVVNSVAESKFDRLTFDGSGSPIVLVDQVWDGVSNYFPANNEYADDNFQNANIGIRAGLLYQPSAGGGSSEISILRDHFTNLKVIGVIPMNFNALDVWVRDSIFDHNTNGVGNWVPNPDRSTYINGAGNVSVYNSIFRYSTIADISLGNTGPFAIRDNYSIGSGRFLNSGSNNASANTTLQGNTILDTTDPYSVVGGNTGPYVMTDNVIRSKSTVTQAPAVWVSDFAGDTDLTAIGNTFTVPSPMYASGRLVDIDNTIVSPSTINPSEPTLPPTEPNMHRPVVEVAVGSSDVQIQQAINFAVAQYNGQRPVVHIPEGTYNLANTVTIPANSDVQLVGDGATFLVYTGSGSGPTVQIQGPSHATLRDIVINGSQRVDALDVSNIDQPGSRVFIFKSTMGGATNANLFFNGLDYTTVDVEDVVYTYERGGADIRVVGGPLAAAGNPQGGKLRIFSGV